MIGRSSSVKGECQRRHEAAIKERIAINHVANHYPVVRVDWIRHIKNVVSRGGGLDQRRPVKRTHIGSHTKIDGYRGRAGIGEYFEVAGEISILRQIDFARYVQARQSVLADDNFPPVLFSGAEAVAGESIGRSSGYYIKEER